MSMKETTRIGYTTLICMGISLSKNFLFLLRIPVLLALSFFQQHPNIHCIDTTHQYILQKPVYYHTQNLPIVIHKNTHTHTQTMSIQLCVFGFKFDVRIRATTGVSR